YGAGRNRGVSVRDCVAVSGRNSGGSQRQVVYGRRGELCNEPSGHPGNRSTRHRRKSERNKFPEWWLLAARKQRRQWRRLEYTRICVQFADQPDSGLVHREDRLQRDAGRETPNIGVWGIGQREQSGGTVSARAASGR